MNYVDFKSNLLTALLGDRPNLPAEPMMKNLLIQNLRLVAKEYEPLILTTSKKDGEILKKLENEQYILAPIVPADENLNIKMDEDLMYVVVYMTAKNLCSSNNIKKHDDSMWQFINNYTWARYETGFTECNNDSIDTYMNEYGYKKIYLDRTMTSNGYVYKWDEEFISILNDYQFGLIDYELSKSDRNNLEKFAKFADGELDTTDEDYEAFEEINKYLGSL